MCQKAVVFDFDGTLVNSAAMWRKTLETYLADYLPDNSRSYLDEIEHLSFGEKCCRFHDELGAGGTVQEVFDDLSSRVITGYANDVMPLPHALEYVAFLHSNGIQLSIASSTPSTIIRNALSNLNIADNFAVIAYTGDVGNDKSRPDVYLEAIERVGSAPEHSIVFEDAVFGYRACRLAGIRTVGITYKKNDQDTQELRRYSTIIIEDYHDLRIYEIENL